MDEIGYQIAKSKKKILRSNNIDVQDAIKANLNSAFIDRLTVTDKIFGLMLSTIREIIALPDPMEEVIERRTIMKGIRLKKVRVPLGVVGIIYESRPNVTLEAAALALKSGINTSEK